MASTRGSHTCPIYDIASELPVTQLPTVGDTMRFYNFLKYKLPSNTKSNQIISEVAEGVLQIWEKSGIPTVSVQRVKQKIEALHLSLAQILKKKGESKLASIFTSKEEGRYLLDIASCHCVNLNDCCCPRDSKVPVIEREFLTDQRNQRKMIIGGLDKATTSRLIKKSERATKRQKYYSDVSYTEGLTTENSFQIDSDSDMNEFEHDNEGEDNLSPNSESSENRSKRNLIKLPTLARECDRYGVSNSAGAAIATATLIDYGIITQDDPSSVIDRSKLRRQREQLRATLTQDGQSNMSMKGPVSLFFDGRKDHTLCSISKNSKGSVSEEHITLIEEPHSVYLGHLTPESGSSANISSAIIDFFHENNTSLHNLIALGADGTNVNTGFQNGVFRLLELHLGRPLQWLVCMFHCNELPLRHLMMHLDGTTSGPSAFSGNVGKALQKCGELSIVRFEPRENKLPTMIQKIEDLDISKDQKYLYNMCIAIKTGHVAESLAKREPGPLIHSRWLTTANRILRLYVGTETPSTTLVILTEYVLRVYAPVWFTIKLEPQCYKGAKHFWLMVSLSRFLPDDARAVVDKCIQRNGFFAHPENVLLTMVVDERKEIRELAARRIKLARQSKAKDIRKFVLPALNMEATEYHCLLDWQNFPRTEPPMLMAVGDEELEAAIETGQKWTLDEIPCHTQAVERHIRVVTEAAASVNGELRRDGYIRAKLSSRRSIPHFESKQDWNFE
jgi:hypothetical protein